MVFWIVICFVLGFVSREVNSLDSYDQFLIDCAKGLTNCENVFNEPVPPLFDVALTSTSGKFVIHVNTSWAPDFAQRFWILSKLKYYDKSGIYRVLNVNSTERFVVQFGIRGVPEVDKAWNLYRTSNVTNRVVSSGNIRGTVSFSMGAIPNNGLNPNCTSPKYCAVGFCTEIFINLADNNRLDASDFSPFGWVSEDDMNNTVDKFYAGYGEVVDLCSSSPDPYCVSNGKGGWLGVNMEELSNKGNSYLQSGFKKLDYFSVSELVLI